MSDWVEVNEIRKKTKGKKGRKRDNVQLLTAKRKQKENTDVETMNFKKLPKGSDKKDNGMSVNDNKHWLWKY